MLDLKPGSAAIADGRHRVELVWRRRMLAVVAHKAYLVVGRPPRIRRRALAAFNAVLRLSPIEVMVDGRRLSSRPIRYEPDRPVTPEAAYVATVAASRRALREARLL